MIDNLSVQPFDVSGLIESSSPVGCCRLLHSFVLFQCVKPPVVGDIGGETLLTDTRRILRSSINAEKLAMLDLASLEAEYYSPASGYFGGRWIQHKFVSPHPITGELLRRELDWVHTRGWYSRDSEVMQKPSWCNVWAIPMWCSRWCIS